MAYNLRNSNKKREHEITREPRAKHRKQIGVEVDETDADVVTSICNELIDRIFNFLDLQSLLNVADTCKRLQMAAVAKYGQKFGKNVVVLDPSKFRSTRDPNPKQGVRFNKNGVEVFGLTALPLLRCFGAHISRIYVEGANTYHVACYINRYCADTLTVIEVCKFDMDLFTIENCPKPFNMVRRVNIDGLGKQFSNFGYWFPNVHKLSFDTERFDYDISSAVFPHLKELSCLAALNSYPEMRRMESFVRVHQQLRFLWIRCKKLQFSKFSKMISGHKLISKMIVGEPNFASKHVKRAQLLRFAREHHVLAEIDFFAFLLKADDAIALICRLKSLNRFSFRIKDRAKYHYFVNQLQRVIGVVFEANLLEGNSTPSVKLRINR